MQSGDGALQRFSKSRQGLGEGSTVMAFAITGVIKGNRKPMMEAVKADKVIGGAVNFDTN